MSSGDLIDLQTSSYQSCLGSEDCDSAGEGRDSRPVIDFTQKNEEEKATVGDINTVVQCLKTNTCAPIRLMHLINKLVPFAKAVPGTPLAFKRAKKELMSIVASPIYEDDHPWRWYITFSNADLFEEYIFRQIFNDGNGNVIDLNGQVLSKEAGERFLQGLTKEHRTKLLREHPAIATRSYILKQQLIMKYIVVGNRTFGEVFDYWIRAEFQRSLNTHLHLILSVRDEEMLGKLVEAGPRLSDGLSKLLQTTVTAQVKNC